MDFKDMTVEQLEERRAAIAVEVEAEDADLDALEEEARGIKAELEERKAAEAKKAEIRSAVASGEGVEVKTFVEETRSKEMTVDEIRNSAEYIDAYANYIKTGNDDECRSLLTSNASGSVPIPEFVYDIVKTAWEREGIMSLVRKTYLKGNLKIGFEISSSEAVAHTEGSGAVSEESLVLGVVEIQPKSIKKWISISDEVYDLRGTDFLNYIYDELTYRIAKKAADTVIDKIEACGTVSTTTCPGIPKLTATTVAVGTVAQAMALLSDEAANPVVMMNKVTWGAFKEAQYDNNYGVDPFEGLPVVFNNKIKTFAAATTGETYAIVGDLGHGAIANFPNGDGIDFKFDEMSRKKEDLIEVLGREYVGIAVVAPQAFTKVVK